VARRKKLVKYGKERVARRKKQVKYSKERVAGSAWLVEKN